MCIVSIHKRGGVNVQCICVHDYTVYRMSLVVVQ